MQASTKFGGKAFRIKSIKVSAVVTYRLFSSLDNSDVFPDPGWMLTTNTMPKITAQTVVPR